MTKEEIISDPLQFMGMPIMLSDQGDKSESILSAIQGKKNNVGCFFSSL